MRLGAIQSNYVPWRGYFDFIRSVDLFVFHDCVQYTKGDWRNRNLVKLPDGNTHWFTVPVHKCPTDTKINEVTIDGEKWRARHKGMLESSFSQSPHKNEAMELWGIFKDGLSDLNQNLTRRICWYLGIRTKLMDSRALNLVGAKTDRLIDLCKKVGADTYLSGPGAKAYLDEEAMSRAGIKVEWKTYNYPDYPQPWGEFNGAVTVLDLIANTGKRARQYI